MTYEQYSEQSDLLINDPKFLRENQTGEYTWDGIVASNETEYKNWQDSPVKIMFLLKEAFGEYHPSHPAKISKSFMLNIIRWKYLIWELAQNGKAPEYPTNDFLREKYNNTNDGIAIVEVKKYDEGQKTSSDASILEYAIKDRELLTSQIELINPEVIICCGTYNSYCNGIYDEDKDNIEHLIYIDSLYETYGVDGTIFLHNNRLILNFYHPSCPKSHEGLYSLLGDLFIKSNGLSLIKS